MSGRLLRSLLVTGACTLSAASCVGETGYKLVTFYAAARGVARRGSGQPYVFTNDQGYEITLTRGTLRVGAVYLDQSVPTSGGGAEPCTLPGTYVGEVRAGVTVDMLSSDLQTFGVEGDGSTIPVAVGQVWLTGDGDVNDANDATTILDVAGTARRNGESYAFAGQYAIDASCFSAPSPIEPGINPICQSRIVTPVLTHLVLGQSGTLILTVDAAPMFTGIDFSMLPVTRTGSSSVHTFGGCTATDIGSEVLFTNFRTASAYSFQWQPAAR